MNGKPAYTLVPPPPRVRAVDDGWGLFDPNKAGLKAAIRAVQPMETPTDDAIELESVDRDDVLEMIFPDDLPAPDSAPHETTVRDLAPPQPGRGPARLVSQGPSSDEVVYDLTEVEQSAPRHKPADKGAVYTLEFPTRCPQCCSEISVVRVSRLLRTQVSFTSTLPRKGYIIVCPECDGILSAELSGLI
jgi:hypothetical protein